MLKFIAFLFITLLAFCTQALGAGSIQLSGSQQFDSQGRPLSGGLLYFFQAGTTTPQSAFQDTALTIPWSNPIVLDASGRVPFFYLADGSIKIRLSTSGGETIIAADNILVIGPSSGGGGGGGVDATTVLATGDMKARYGAGTLTGFVRANGRTIGSAVSGATERANSDCQTLFEYLWNADATLAVSGGRGSTANADWLANKTIALPDLRGRAIAGLDAMGNTAANRLTSALWGGTSGDTLGQAGGSQGSVMTTAQMPTHSHANTLNDAGHTHSFTPAGTISHGSASIGVAIAGAPSISIQTLDIQTGAAGSAFSPTGTAGLSSAGISPGVGSLTGSFNNNQVSATFSGSAGTTVSGSTGMTITNASAGSGAAFPTATPSMVMTIYIKL